MSTLRTATGPGVASLWTRVDRLSRRVSARPLDFSWLRTSPLVVLRDRAVHQDLHVTAALRVAWNRTVSAPGVPLTTMAMAIHPGPIAPRLESIVERHHLETRIVERPAQPTPPAPATAAPLARPPAIAPISPPAPQGAAVPLAVRREALGPRPEMIVARPSQAAAAVAPPASPLRETEGRPRASAPLATNPAVAELRIDRITTEVVRALDARLLAFRERMGDR